MVTNVSFMVFLRGQFFRLWMRENSVLFFGQFFGRADFGRCIFFFVNSFIFSEIFINDCHFFIGIQLLNFEETGYSGKFHFKISFFIRKSYLFVSFLFCKKLAQILKYWSPRQVFEMS